MEIWNAGGLSDAHLLGRPGAICIEVKKHCTSSLLDYLKKMNTVL